jgi:hypothetical protein
VTVLGGAAGPAGAWAPAGAIPMAAIPAQAPSPCTKWRLERAMLFVLDTWRLLSSFVIDEPPPWQANLSLEARSA